MKTTNKITKAQKNIIVTLIAEELMLRNKGMTEVRFVAKRSSNVLDLSLQVYASRPTSIIGIQEQILTTRQYKTLFNCPFKVLEFSAQESLGRTIYVGRINFAALMIEQPELLAEAQERFNICK